MGDPGALLIIEMLPEAFPEADGLKAAVKVVLCPAEIVVALERLAIVNAPPLRLT